MRPSAKLITSVMACNPSTTWWEDLVAIYLSRPHSCKVWWGKGTEDKMIFFLLNSGECRATISREVPSAHQRPHPPTPNRTPPRNPPPPLQHTKLVPCSGNDSQGFSWSAINCNKAIRKESVSTVGRRSICTAQVVRHSNRIPRLFSCRHPMSTI